MNGDNAWFNEKRNEKEDINKKQYFGVFQIFNYRFKTFYKQ